MFLGFKQADGTFKKQPTQEYLDELNQAISQEFDLEPSDKEKEKGKIE